MKYYYILIMAAAGPLFSEPVKVDCDQGSGSGVMISDTYYLSARHIMEVRPGQVDANPWKITFRDGSTTTATPLHWVDDVVILKGPRDTTHTPSKLSPNINPKVGDKIQWYGFDFSQLTRPRTGQGRITSVNNLTFEAEVPFGTSPIPGDSGGPVYNAKGEVISVISASDWQPAPNGGVIKGRYLYASTRKVVETVCPGGVCPPQFQGMEPVQPWGIVPQQVNPGPSDPGPSDPGPSDPQPVPVPPEQGPGPSDPEPSNGFLDTIRRTIIQAPLTSVLGPVAGLAIPLVWSLWLKRKAAVSNNQEPRFDPATLAEAFKGVVTEELDKRSVRPNNEVYHKTLPPEPPIVKTNYEQTYVPYESDAFQAAFYKAAQDLVRKYPATAGTTETLTNMIKQTLNGG